MNGHEKAWTLLVAVIFEHTCECDSYVLGVCPVGCQELGCESFYLFKGYRRCRRPLSGTEITDFTARARSCKRE